MLIGSYKLIQSYVANPQSSTFSQPHSFPLDVRHNLLLSKESASSSCKAAYPFVQGSELVAVQIIAVDTERNSGLRKAGYLMKAGYPNQNTVSTGDLNRGRRACRLLETWSPCSHPFAILPVSALSDAQKVTLGPKGRYFKGSREQIRVSLFFSGTQALLPDLRYRSSGRIKQIAPQHAAALGHPGKIQFFRTA